MELDNMTYKQLNDAIHEELNNTILDFYHGDVTKTWSNNKRKLNHLPMRRRDGREGRLKSARRCKNLIFDLIEQIMENTIGQFKHYDNFFDTMASFSEDSTLNEKSQIESELTPRQEFIKNELIRVSKFKQDYYYKSSSCIGCQFFNGYENCCLLTGSRCYENGKSLIKNCEKYVEGEWCEMRDATPEERRSVKSYIESISEETGTNFYDILVD